MKKLRELRNKNNQTETGKIFGIDQKTYSNYENGKTEPPLDLLVKIANYYNVTVDYLLENEKNNTNISNAEIDILNKLKKLNQKDQQSIINLINSLSTKEH